LALEPGRREIGGAGAQQLPVNLIAFEVHQGRVFALPGVCATLRVWLKPDVAAAPSRSQGTPFLFARFKRARRPQGEEFMKSSVPIRPAVLAGVLLYAPAPALAQDSDPGQVAFNNACRTCHTTREGDNRLGPSLYGVIGRKAGSLPGYTNHSESMKKAELVWDKNNLDRFIANPDQVVPSNNMKPFGGIASAEERAKIIAFLEKAGR
jgi:cytochrome c